MNEAKMKQSFCSMIELIKIRTNLILLWKVEQVWKIHFPVKWI